MRLLVGAEDWGIHPCAAVAVAKGVGVGVDVGVDADVDVVERRGCCADLDDRDGSSATSENRRFAVGCGAACVNVPSAALAGWRDGSARFG